MEILRILRSVFFESKIEGYIVGGFLRDTLVNVLPKDMDLVVDSNNVDFVVEKLTLLLNGHSSYLKNSENLLRISIDSDKYGISNIDILPLKNSIHENLSKRDFTVNAMALNLNKFDGHSIFGKGFIDPFNGKTAMEKKWIIPVSNNVFDDDPLRMLRAIILMARLNLFLTSKMKLLIKSKANLISSVAPERFRTEFLSLLEMNNAKYYLQELRSLGILEAAIPELKLLEQVEQPKQHFWDVNQHSYETVGQIERILNNSKTDNLISIEQFYTKLLTNLNRPIGDGFSRTTYIKFAALLHDICKPETKTVDKTGKMHFLKHEELGAIKAGEIAVRFRFSSKAIMFIEKLIKYHLRPRQLASPGQYPTKKAIGKFFKDIGDEVFDVILLNLADFLAAKGPTIDVWDWYNYIDQINYVVNYAENNNEMLGKLVIVNGRDIMKELGLKQGPIIGIILDKIWECQCEGFIRNRIEALNYAKKFIKSEEMNVQMV